MNCLSIAGDAVLTLGVAAGCDLALGVVDGKYAWRPGVQAYLQAMALTLSSVYWEAVRLAGYGVEVGYDAASTVQKKPCWERLQHM
jgi:hypothetical protein